MQNRVQIEWHWHMLDIQIFQQDVHHSSLNGRHIQIYSNIVLIEANFDCHNVSCHFKHQVACAEQDVKLYSIKAQHRPNFLFLRRDSTFYERIYGELIY